MNLQEEILKLFKERNRVLGIYEAWQVFKPIYEYQFILEEFRILEHLRKIKKSGEYQTIFTLCETYKEAWEKFLKENEYV